MKPFTKAVSIAFMMNDETTNFQFQFQVDMSHD